MVEFGARLRGDIDIGVYCWLYVHYNQAVILLCNSAHAPSSSVPWATFM